MKSENTIQQKKKNELSPKKQLNYSFTKEFINTISVNSGEEEDEKNVILAKSHFGLGDFIKMQEQILGECNEVSSTVLDEKIKRKMCEKGFDIRRIKTFVNHDDIDVNEIEKNNIDESINFLKVREIPSVSKEDFDKMKYNLLDDNYLEDLKNYIIKFKYSVDSPKSTLTIGALFPLERLIECAFNNNAELIEDMNSKNDLYKEYIFNYRTIKGDGNCYYRAVMFRYFEIIIINKEISLLQNIISDMYNSFNSEEIMSRKEIKMNTVFKAELPLKIMIIILDSIQKNNIELAHFIFVKSLLICPIFDFGLIFYFRYIMYSYIKENEEKLYLQSFPIKIGNLLPSKYETEEGEFLFDSFYQNYLLKMFMDAEKIIVYLTPFVLGMNLDIIIFGDESEIVKKINYEGKPKYSFEEKIFLMNRKNHYELIYTQKDNIKYEELFEKYINNDFLKVSLILLDLREKHNMITNKNFQSHANKNNVNRNNLINTNIELDKDDDLGHNKKIVTSIKKKKIKKKIKKKSLDKDSPQEDEESGAIHKSEKLKIKIGRSSVPTNSVNVIKKVDVYENMNNSINNSINNGKNRKQLNNKENEKSAEIDDEEATKETSMTFSEKNRIIKEENKNNIINNSITGIFKKKIYKKNAKITGINKTKSFKYKTIGGDDIIKKTYYTIIDENTNNILLNKYSSNLENSTSINTEKKIKKKKIIKTKDIENDNINTNENYSTQKKQKPKVSSTGKRFERIATENKRLKITETKNISEILTNEPKITSLTLENGKEKKKVLVIGFECEKCHKIDGIRQKKEKIFGLCKECAKKEIIEKFCDKYLFYIKDCLLHDYDNNMLLAKFNEILKNEVIINRKSITIENSIIQLSKYKNIITKKNPDPDSNAENTNTDIFSNLYKNIFDEVKKSICLVCCVRMENNTDKQVIIPCGCHFCCETHLEYYFREKKSIIKNKEYKDFMCYCTHQYSLKNMYDLGIFFSKFDNKSINKLKKNVMEYFNCILMKQCCACENKEIILNKIRYKDKDENLPNEEKEDILSGYKELKHFFCKICTEKIKEKEKFLCKICDKEHIFYPKNKH